MSEKPESEEFEEEDAEDAAPARDDAEVDQFLREVDAPRRRAPKGAEPAWRRLERVMEERRTAELMSDFDDYEIAGAEDDAEHESVEPIEDDEPDEPDPPEAPEAPKSAAKGVHKKKKAR
jgi:hypothetical protein